MADRIPNAADPFEEEGLPGMNDGLPAKRITGDAQEGIPAPGDSTVAAEDYGTTAAEERAGEPLDLRLSREEPDLTATDAADAAADADTPYPVDRDERAGRLVAPDEGARPDREPDAAGSSVGVDEGGFSAEERAIHVEPEA